MYLQENFQCKVEEQHLWRSSCRDNEREEIQTCSKWDNFDLKNEMDNEKINIMIIFWKKDEPCGWKYEEHEEFWNKLNTI